MDETEIDARGLFKTIVVLIAHLQSRGLVDAAELAHMLRSATGEDDFDYQLRALADAISPDPPAFDVIEGGRQDD